MVAIGGFAPALGHALHNESCPKSGCHGEFGMENAEDPGLNRENP